MKIKAIILSLYFCSQLLVPALAIQKTEIKMADIECCKGETGNPHQNRKDNHKNCCNDKGMCNSIACNNCCLFFQNTSKFSFILFETKSNYNISLSIKNASNFNYSCFHPPEESIFG